MAQAMRVGIIGCGNICGQYIKFGKTFDMLELAAFADLDMDRARQRAQEAGGAARAMTVDELLADDAIDIVVNLTIPQAHGEIALRTIAAGKHAYCEKPLALSRDEGRRVLEAAKQKGVRVGCAPDTFLGAGQQTARKLVDDGTIGQVVAGTAFMLCGGHESWHPSPEFYYKAGGGPMFDMGPY
jgi:predicted dehydrogenase